MKSKRASVAKVVALAVVPLVLAAVVVRVAQHRREEMPLQAVIELVPTAKALQVRLSVLNPSNRYEIFQRMTCSWEDNWRCDAPGVALAGHSCSRNFPETIILPLHSAHHEEAGWLRFSRLDLGQATFRFGLVRGRSNFTSEELERIYNSRERSIYFSRGDISHHYKGGTEVFWSNQVVTAVRSEWLPH